MKITFVHIGREHLGVEYLSSVLKANGHETFLAYDPGLFGQEDNVFYIPFLERLFNKKSRVIQEIKDSQPDLVAFTVYTSTYPWASDIAKVIKEELGVKTVFGGIHVSLVPEEVIKNDFVDFIIKGESEFSLLELVEAMAIGAEEFKIPNVWYKKNDEIIKNPHRPAIQDLDILPFPDKEIFQQHINYRDDYVIMTSRGCLFNCSYCCDSYLNDMYDRRFNRRRSISSVIDELKVMREKYNFRRVMFFDSILFSNRGWISEFLPVYKEEIGLPFRCTGHVSLADRNTLEAMKEAGCYCIDFGVQSFNEKIRRQLLNRNETNEKIDKAFSLCDELQLRYDVDLIIGLPLMTEEDYRLPIEFMQRHKYFNRLKTYNLTYYPSLSLIPKARDLGVINDEDVQNFQRGDIGDWFHNSKIKDIQEKKMCDGFSKIYKLYPLFPQSLKRKILEKKLYRHFYLIPSIIVIILQLTIGIFKRDYRFYIYINNYLGHFGKQLVLLLKRARTSLSGFVVGSGKI